MLGVKKPKALKRIEDLQPLRKNPNKHTERGSGMMEASIREVGFGDSLTVDRNGVVLSGNQRLETVADIGLKDPIIVQSDGTRPIVHQRIDLDANDVRGRKLAVLANRVGEVNLEWDPAIIRELRADDIDLSKAFSDKEIDRLLGAAPAPPAEESGIEMQITCPECGHKFSPKEDPGHVKMKGTAA